MKYLNIYIKSLSCLKTGIEKEGTIEISNSKKIIKKWQVINTLIFELTFLHYHKTNNINLRPN